jgi:ribonuclease BN (tRNA processing enzyme)
MTKQTDVPFTVKVLGSGTCVPSASRYPAAYFVRPSTVPGGWLLDVGPCALQRLVEAGESYRSLAAVFVSHTHTDHIAGLLPLLQALNYTPGFRRMLPLTLYGPESVQQYLSLNLDFAPYLRPSFPFAFVTLSDRTHIEGDGWQLLCRATQHMAPTLGFRFSACGCTLVYGADTEPCQGVIELAAEADLLVLEASFPRGQPARGHLTTYQAGQIASAAGARTLLISHAYPQVAAMQPDEREGEVRASGFNGELVFAEDLLSLEVRSASSAS